MQISTPSIWLESLGEYLGLARTVSVRRRIFIGCEGASERSYARWLQGLADTLGKHLFFDSYDAGGGDPLAIVQESAKRLKSQERLKGKYAAKAVILDSDKIGESQDRDREMRMLADATGLVLLKQEPIHEALLLRHLPNCHNLRPSKQRAIPRLRKEWTDYTKPADAITLRSKLSVDGFTKMLEVEPNFSDFLGRFIL